MLGRKSDPSKVDMRLFYEFAKIVLEDIENLQAEIRRLKKEAAKR